MNCPSCGKQVQQDDSFCMHCGASLANLAQPAAGVEPVPSAPLDAAPWQTAAGFGGEPPADQHAALPHAADAGPRDDEAVWAHSSEPRRSSSGRWLGLLALLLVLFGLAAAGGYLLQRTVFRGNDEQPDAAATAQPLQPPAGEHAALESAQSEPQPPVDPNTLDPSASEFPAENPPDPPSASSSAANEAGANSGHPDAVRKGSPVPTTPGKQSGNSAAIAPQGSAAPQPKVAVSSAGQATKTAPAANPTASAQGTIPASGVAEQPRPAPQEAAPAANASAAAIAGGTAQPHTDSPAEAAIAAASETAATRPRTPRNEVFRPDAQTPPRPASQNQSVSSAAAGGLPSPAPAPQPTEEGIIYWTGRLTKNQVIVIEQGKASIGMADGGLPAIPVDVWLPSPAVTLVERPTSQNNWSRVAFRCLQSTNRNVTLNIQWKRLR